MPAYPLRLALAALAVVAVPLSMASAHDSDKKEPVIVVSGQGDASVVPDLAIVTLSVAETARTAREALDINNGAMTSVMKALKDQGIADRDLQTSGLAIQPQYSYPQNEDGTPKLPILNGYTVTNGLTVRVRDLAKLGAILDQSVTSGVNQGGDIRFTNDDPEKALEEARTEAVKNAAVKAKTLADAAGVKLGRAVEISEGAGGADPQPMMRMQMAKEAADAVPIAAGENTYVVNVSVTFAIAE
ncbi:SIMPL domain-containing protein [Rhizobium sp. LjRoot254]|uniref:SIMPL domain-containing protein n=1 Tax=Rhizobium sp. LjRoot254 TaxID=3342297 RepID=UPI003ECEFC02